jgi:hypothetical protein
VYRIDPTAFGEQYRFPDNEVFVNPESGYVERVEHNRVYWDGELLGDGYSMGEFSRHDDIGTLNLDQFDVIDSPI